MLFVQLEEGRQVTCVVCWENQYPRLQVLTIKELLDGKRVQYPALTPVAIFKRAERKGKQTAEQQPLAL